MDPKWAYQKENGQFTKTNKFFGNFRDIEHIFALAVLLCSPKSQQENLQLKKGARSLLKWVTGLKKFDVLTRLPLFPQSSTHTKRELQIATSNLS